MAQEVKPQVTRVPPQKVRSMLGDHSELAFLDVREDGQFGEAHPLFATPLPYSRLEPGIVSLVPRRDTPIVLCDQSGKDVALLAAQRLYGIGYTNVSVLEGGIAGWANAGYVLFRGVNVPSKLFGELIEHVYHTPRITAQDVVRMRDAGENFVIVDGRPFGEYQKMTIPGSTCCPNAELAYRIPTMVKDPQTKIVVNCAGRTRSIVGAQTLINFGVPNPVYALENGTQGWYLADLKLEKGSIRRYPDQVDTGELPSQQAAAKQLMERFSVRCVNRREAETWFKDPSRTTYLCDVRTPEEFAQGSLPGAVHAPGGQLVQATDQWIGVRNARIVLIDSDGVRAPVVASWLKQLGCDVSVLGDGIRSGLSAPLPVRPTLPDIAMISATQLKSALRNGRSAVLDLRPSVDFRKNHIPGSRWSIRPRLAATAQNGKASTVILVADEVDVARVGAIDLREAGFSDVKMLEGGIEAWIQAGNETEASPDAPPDSERIDHLFFVHDRHAGNREAMKQYLAWETGLIAQLDERDRAQFNVGPVSGHA